MVGKTLKLAMFSLLIGVSPLATLSTLALEQEASTTKIEVKSSGASNLDNIFKSQAKEYEAAFAACDAKKIAAMWSEKGTYIDTDGWEYSGRKAIEDKYKDFFSRKKGKIAISVQSVQPIGDAAAIEKGIASFSDIDGNLLSSCTYTVVHVRNDGRWEIASATDHGEVDAQSQMSLKDMAWMLGEWHANGANGDATVVTKFANGNSFLVTRFELKDKNGKGREEMQITGFDPTQNALVSWIFDSNGGFGQARWYSHGKTWESRMNRITPGGQRLSSVNYWQLEAPDKFTWQSTRRVFEGMDLPDSERITVSRVNVQAQ
ncbi:MAG: SgcJ/EcaC family oxidoreductase [Candidatus Melainabacteria bacterium]|nr:SgcJ/EcaC family oxidoreductase [Candidatus Melainabacteria bacterium]